MSTPNVNTLVDWITEVAGEYIEPWVAGVIAESWQEDKNRLRESQNDIDRLNQMLRATGYGQGQIDAYVAQCEDIDTLQALVEEAQGILTDNMLDEGYSEFMERADKALEPPR